MAKKKIEFDELEVLPKGWKWISLDELMIEPKIDIVDGPFGSNLKASEYINEGIPIARLQNIDRNQFIFKNIKYISPEKTEELGRHNFLPGDILITKLGAPLGKACVVPKKISKGIIVADIVRVRTRIESINRYYLCYAINSPFIVEQFEKHTKGTTRPRVNLGVIRKLPIPISPPTEQKRIVAEIEKQFSRLDEAVENLQRVKANLKRYKASVLKSAVEGKLTEQWRAKHPDVEPASQLLVSIPKKNKITAYEFSESPIDGLPTTWCIANMDQLIEYVTSGSRGWAKYYSKTGDLFIRAQNLKNDKLELDDVAYVKLPGKAEGKRTLIQKNDILITITGANVTKTAIVDYVLNQKAYVNQHIALTRPAIPELSAYLFIWIICPSYGRKYLEKAAYGAGKPGLSLTNIRELTVTLPPLAEQKQIVEEVNQKFTIIDQLEIQINRNFKRADRLRQSILKKAFAGQLVPQDQSDEPASILMKNLRQKRDPIAEKPAKKKRKPKQSKKGIRVKSKKNKRNLSEVLARFAEGITPEKLLDESNYSIAEIDEFYMQLGKIADKVEQIKPTGEKAFKWPYEAEVILRLRSA